MTTNLSHQFDHPQDYEDYYGEYAQNKYFVMADRVDESLRYDHLKNTVSLYDLCKKLTKAHWGYIFEKFFNSFDRTSRDAENFGKALSSWHPTLQQTFVRWVIGVLRVLANKRFTDARNEAAIKVCRKIIEAVGEDYLPLV